jgi:hypothetical protein
VALSLKVNWHGSKAGHWPPQNIEVKVWWSCALMLWSLIKYRNKSFFYLAHSNLQQKPKTSMNITFLYSLTEILFLDQNLTHTKGSISPKAVIKPKKQYCFTAHTREKNFK